MAVSPSVINKIKWVLFQRLEPDPTAGILWAKPVGDTFSFLVYDDGTWKDIGDTVGIVIPEISTSISAFTNDAGYLTAVDLSGYSTTEEMNAAIQTALADYYTKTEADTLLGSKQDTISDLSTIRSGAQAGATAYQKPQAGIPVSDLALGMDNVPTSGSDNFVKSGGVYSALQDKQDTLVSGTNIKTINNQSILGSGNITIQGGGSSVQSDWNQTDTEADDYIKNKPTIPDVPSWALAPTKPTYTANEVGAIPNAELFYGDGRQDGINYVNKLCDTLWAANKRWDVSVNVTDAGGNTVDPDAYYPNMLFDLNYEGTALVLNLETTAIVLIKGGSDITDTTSRFFSFSEGAIYVHAHSIYHLPKSVSGRVYKQDGTPGWVTLTFVKMDNPANCYKAEVGSECKYPSALELTIEARDSGNPTIIDEIEWWVKRQGSKDTPLMAKYQAETLYYPLNVKDYIGATQFKVTGSNNNYVLLGGGGTKALTTFFSGNYNDLTNKPTIPVVPTNVSAFTNDAGYLTQHQDISGKADKSEMSVTDGTGTDADKTTITLKTGTSATVLKSHQSLSGKQDVIDSSHKLSADLVDDTNTTNKFTNATEKQAWNGKQDALVSGTNIKTINNESLLGSGNITIQGGGGSQVQSDWNQSDNTAVDYIKNKPTIPTITFRTWTTT